MIEEEGEETIVQTIADQTLTHATGNTTKILSRTTESDRAVVIEMTMKEDTRQKDEEVTTILTNPRTNLMSIETMMAASTTINSKMVTQMKETETTRMKITQVFTTSKVTTQMTMVTTNKRDIPKTMAK
jgi:hypothetical protein